MLLIELGHAVRVEKDQRDKYIDRSLLGEPEAELITADADIVQRFDEDDPEQV